MYLQKVISRKTFKQIVFFSVLKVKDENSRILITDPDPLLEVRIRGSKSITLVQIINLINLVSNCLQAFHEAETTKGMPTCILAKTFKVPYVLYCTIMNMKPLQYSIIDTYYRCSGLS
jgi:hypothetical protein